MNENECETRPWELRCRARRYLVPPSEEREEIRSILVLTTADPDGAARSVTVR